MSIPEEFSRFPDHWDVLPFTKAVKDATSGNIKIQTSDYLEDGLIPIVDQGQLHYGGFTDDKLTICKSELPTIVFGDHTRVFKYIEEPFALGADGAKVLEPLANLDKRFLFHYLKQLKIESAGYSRHYKFLKETYVPVPPLAEQKRIAEILDKADAIRQKRQQAITLADQFLRSVFLDMFGDPVTNPKGWEVIKLGSCCRFQGGFAFKSEDYCDSGIPLVKITNVHFENIDWSDVSYVPADFLDTKAEFALKDEDLVMAMTRPIIKSLNAVKVVEVKEMDLPCLLNQRVGRFIDYENSFKKHFLKYLLYSDFFMNEVEKLCSVALQPNISSKQIEAITCYIPPIELQDEFSQIAKQIEQTIPHMSSFNDLDLFGSLNSKAFSGQL